MTLVHLDSSEFLEDVSRDHFRPVTVQEAMMNKMKRIETEWGYSTFRQLQLAFQNWDDPSKIPEISEMALHV